MPGLAIAGHSDNQNIDVMATENGHNNDKRDGDASQESDLISTGHKNKVSEKIESDPTTSRPRDAKIATNFKVTSPAIAGHSEKQDKSDFTIIGHENKVLDLGETDQNMSDFNKMGHKNKVLHPSIEPEQNISDFKLGHRNKVLHQ